MLYPCMQSCHLQEVLFNRKIITKQPDCCSLEIKNRDLWSLLNTRRTHTENTKHKLQSMLRQNNMNINMQSKYRF